MARIALLALLIPLFLQANELSDKAVTVLKENCYVCHGAAMQLSKLDLRTRDSILRGGERGAAVIPNYPEQSLLYNFAIHKRNPTMPPGKKLPEADLEVLRRWIAAGAILENTTPAEMDQKAALAKMEERPITAEERKFWSFQQPVRHPLPKVKNDSWVRNPVDAFLLAAMEEKGLKPSPEAGKRTLVRRAYLDLIGLPPTREQVQGFLDNDSPKAWERLVDELLASPHYGERWARHWLDLVRFADSGGFERDFDWPSMWRYRDYVVDSLNTDKPYDQFVREQIAGDEIAPDSAEAQIATAFLRLGPDNNNKDERTRMDELDDILATTGLTFLGMTVQCARCHNHKFDPIPQKDYYRMQAVFFSTKLTDHPLVGAEEVERVETENKRIDDLQKPLKEQSKALLQPHRDQLFKEYLAELPDYMQAAWNTSEAERTDGQRLNARQLKAAFDKDYRDDKTVLPRATDAERQQHEKLRLEIEQLDKSRPEPFPTAMTITEDGRDALPSYFLHRGSPDNKGSLMAPGVLTVASRSDPDFPPAPEQSSTSGRRKAFADWVASPENPLPARVLVNRLWQHHFGEGIVRSPSNFGATGQAPTHPELLDWLAVEFIEKGWSIKAIHRLMMTSSAYRMASTDIDDNHKVDPGNYFVWRMPRQRLEAEAMRDSILAVAGTIDRTHGGPAVFPYINPDLFQSSTSRTWPGQPDRDPSTWRRSIYVFSKRSIRYPMFEAFDQPDMISSCDRRNRSTVAPQALLLMNNAFINMQAKFFAQRVQMETGTEPEAQVERAFELALARPPNDYEREKALKFVTSDPHGLVDLCQTLFNLNEFAYLQ